LTLVFYILIGVLGAAFGSFFNVCIHRIPAKQSIAFPPSHCPFCNAPIRPWQNIPVLSYIFLGGRCANCKARIHWHYPLVEIVTPLVFMVLFHRFGLTVLFAKYVVFYAISLILFFIDLFHQLLPDSLTLPLVILGLVFAFIPGTDVHWLPALIGGGFAFGFFLLLAWGYSKARGREGLGGGDVKYIAAVGVFLGMPAVLFSILYGSVAALLIAPAALFLQRAPKSDGVARTTFPFGPFLVLGAFLQTLFGERVIDFYLRLLP
jgi:leader peptidase (prepilin peptidase) / N-methyltransferase